MHFRRPFSIFLAVFLFSISVAAQQPPLRDPQALAILAQSLTVIGGATPGDSVASGNVTFYVGGEEEKATLRILTRGLRQYRQEVNTSSRQRVLTFSRGRASSHYGTDSEKLLSHNAVNDYCPYFPLASIMADLKNPDLAVQYLGAESIDGSPGHRVRLWNTFASNPEAASAEIGRYTATEVWIDATSLLPRKLAFSVFAREAPNEPIPVEITYAAYGNFGGVLYPTRILKNFNGTPYALIEIQQVLLNVGLTEADFAVK